MTETPIETNKRLAREYYLVLDKDGPDAGGDYVAPNFAYYGANHTGFDNLTADEQGRAFYKAFPDFTHVILEQIGEGDIVVERIRYFATHRDVFMGIPATGRRITFTGIDWVRFEDGKAWPTSSTSAGNCWESRTPGRPAATEPSDAQATNWPPSTASNAPVMKSLAGSHRKETARVTSSGTPSRPIGCCFSSMSTNWSLSRPGLRLPHIMSVSIAPGSSALTRTLNFDTQ